jgi:hypothetical protein
MFREARKGFLITLPYIDTERKLKLDFAGI